MDVVGWVCEVSKTVITVTALPKGFWQIYNMVMVWNTWPTVSVLCKRIMIFGHKNSIQHYIKIFIVTYLLFSSLMYLITLKILISSMIYTQDMQIVFKYLYSCFPNRAPLLCVSMIALGRDLLSTKIPMWPLKVPSIHQDINIWTETEAFLKVIFFGSDFFNIKTQVKANL